MESLKEYLKVTSTSSILKDLGKLFLNLGLSINSDTFDKTNFSFNK